LLAVPFPWFFTVTVKVTLSPSDGCAGDKVMSSITRSGRVSERATTFDFWLWLAIAPASVGLTEPEVKINTGNIMVTVRILLIIWYSLPDERVNRLFPKLRLSSHHGKNAGKNKKASDYFVDGGYFTEY